MDVHIFIRDTVFFINMYKNMNLHEHTQLAR